MTTLSDLSEISVAIGNTETITLVSNTETESITAALVDANLDILHELAGELDTDGVTATVVLPETATNLAKYRGTLLQVTWVLADSSVINTRLNLVGSLSKTLSAGVAVITTGGSIVTISTGVGLTGPTGPSGTVFKIAVSGLAHPLYGTLTMANNNTEATIPGAGSINPETLLVVVRGVIQTDFTLNGRVITLGYSPNLDNTNRMVVQYEDI